jgi:hypothetical protein
MPQNRGFDTLSRDQRPNLHAGIHAAQKGCVARIGTNMVEPRIETGAFRMADFRVGSSCVTLSYRHFRIKIE